jgi:uncharacterized protein YggE
MDINPSPTLISASRGVRYAAVAALTLLALFLFAQTWATFNEMGHINPANVATISVTGTGKASTAPTIATINFTVQENASTVAAAQDAATKRTDAALASIKKLGVADADVKTNGYNVSPQYETKPCAPGVFCPQNTSKISGYQVSQSVDVKVRDTAKAGDVLAALGTAGVQNVSGPNFTVDDTSAVDAEARGKAIADAHAKAQALAKQLGVHLGRVVSFSENGGYPTPYFAQAKSAGMDASVASAPTLPPGQNESNVTVTVVYEIQ